MLKTWLGTAESLFAVMRDIDAAIERYGSLNAMHHQIELRHDDDDDCEMNPVEYQLVGSVAVLSISGPTITKSSFFSRIFGIPSYQDIKERFVQAHDDHAVKAVLLDIDSPGGNADGCFSLSRFIFDFNKSVMPVISFDNNDQCSAAVLYGSAAGTMIADQDASIGSIGAVGVHKEITEALKMNGIKATVFRSAPYKALGLPYEKLSDTAREEIQKDLMKSHDHFVSTLSHNTGVELKSVKTWATGKVFDAEEALKMGLLDSVQPIENVIANLNKRLENAPRKGAR